MRRTSYRYAILMVGVGLIMYALRFSPVVGEYSRPAPAQSPLFNYYVGNQPQMWQEDVSFDDYPRLTWGTFLGGGGVDAGWSVAVDEEGNVYVSGVTYSADFPLLNAVQRSFGGEKDVFVAKFSPEGELIFATYLGGSISEEGNGLAVDQQGNVYVAGETYSPDFPVKNAWQAAFAGDEDAYVAKLDGQGHLLFSTFIGGSESEEVDDITVDRQGNVYLGGEVYSDDFPLLHPWQTEVYGMDDEDAFLSIFNSDGQLIYSTYIGAPQRDQIFRIAVDEHGIVYAAGMSSSPAFPVVNPLQGTYGGGWDDCIVLKFDPWHNQMLYSSFFGGVGRDECWGLDIDNDGLIYLSGATNSWNFPVRRAFQPRYGGGEYDAFFSIIDPVAKQVVVSSYIGGQEEDRSWGLTLDGAGHAYVVGATASEDFPLVLPLQGHYGGGEADGFLLQITQGQLSYASYLGGVGLDRAWRVTARNGDVYVVGESASPEIFSSAHHGSRDAFVTRWAMVPTPTPTPTPTPYPSAVQHIGPEGGAVWTARPGHLELITIPAGQLTRTVVITLSEEKIPNAQGDLYGQGGFFRIGVEGLTLTQSIEPPIGVTVGFTSHGAILSDTLTLYHFDPVGAKWVTETITVTEQTPSYLRAQLHYPGLYGLLGRTIHLYLPTVWRSER